jgi:hypothetical protein
MIISLTFLFLATSGGVENSGSNQIVDTPHLNFSIVSFTDTPVRYADVSQVTLVYREFGSESPS